MNKSEKMIREWIKLEGEMPKNDLVAREEWYAGLGAFALGWALTDNWIAVEERLPEKENPRIGWSKKVMVVVKDPNWEPDGIDEIDIAFPSRWLEEGRLFFPTSGGHVWLNFEEGPIEELGCLVTHWTFYPDLPEEK